MDLAHSEREIASNREDKLAILWVIIGQFVIMRARISVEATPNASRTME